MGEGWKEQKERSNPFTLRLICLFARSMPRKITRLWLWPITLYFMLFAPKARAASRNYLKRLPGQRVGYREIFKHIHAFSSVILDRVYFLTDRYQKFRFDFHGNEALSKIISQGRGAILLGAHVGSFEVMRCLAIRNEKIPLKILMYQEHNAMITQVLDQLNAQVSGSVINLAEDNALFQAKESLENGYIIGMLGDRALDNEKSISCKLLGDEVKIPTGPFSLSMMLGVPIIMFFGIYRGGNRYSIFISTLSEGEIVPRKRREAAISELLSEYVENIEKMLISYPYNWFNFYDYWGDQK